MAVNRLNLTVNFDTTMTSTQDSARVSVYVQQYNFKTQESEAVPIEALFINQAAHKAKMVTCGTNILLLGEYDATSEGFIPKIYDFVVVGEQDSVNHLTLVGRVGKEPEIRTWENGSNLQMSVAQDVYRNREKQTLWINCKIGDKLNAFKVIEQYVHKGSQIGLDGYVVFESYISKASGRDVIAPKLSITGVQLLGSKGDSTSATPSTGEVLD